jgi:hypothetical protein
MMSRYERLGQFLDSLSDDVWQAKFNDIEHILGFVLPASARRYSAWWANQRGPGHSQVRGWRDVGWRTGLVDLKRESVRFERAPESPRATGKNERQQLTALAADMGGVGDSCSLSTAELRFLLERIAIERLIALGGTMPDFAPAPRERPFG